MPTGEGMPAENSRRDFMRTAGAFAAGSGLASGSRAHDNSSAAEKARNFSVTAFGASGNGKTIDTLAINHAIDAAAASGGGTVHFPAGSYLCYSIRLKSKVTLHL